jgi:hypothetical protein
VERTLLSAALDLAFDLDLAFGFALALASVPEHRNTPARQPMPNLSSRPKQIIAKQ